MPAIIALLWSSLASIIGPLVGRALVALGIGVATYSGLDVAVSTFSGYVQTSLGGLPATLVALAGILKLDVAVNIILGAVAARMTLTAAGGIVTRFKLSAGT